MSGQLMWLTVPQCAKAMGCHRRTAYRRFRALEDRLGRPVLVTRSPHGREVLTVRRSDLERALRMAGAEAESQDISEMKQTLELLVETVERLIRLVQERA